MSFFHQGVPVNQWRRSISQGLKSIAVLGILLTLSTATAASWLPFYPPANLGECQAALRGGAGDAWAGESSAEKIVQVAPRTPKRDWASVHSLKIMSYNVENLFWRVGKYERNDRDEMVFLGHDKKGRKDSPELKPEAKTEEIRQIIEKEDSDIIVIQEVESLEALRHLADNGLKGRYESFLVPGNDGRGINIGYLVKTDLPVYVSELTNREVTYQDPVTRVALKLFSRDVPALIVRTTPTSAPVAIVLGNHAKSKRDRSQDPESNRLRTAQYAGIARVVADYKSKYGADAPIILAGDFNTDVRTAPEIAPIRGVLKSAFDLAKQTVPSGDRITHSFHGGRDGTVYSQLDDVRVVASLAQRVLAARVVSYKDKSGRALPLPKTGKERAQQPSDHRAVVVEIAVIH